MRKLIIGSLVAATLSGLSIPAAARTNVDFFVNVAPPVAPVELVPAPRRGYVWAPGHWDWRGHRHHWVRGHWVRHRPGYYYQPVKWVHRDGRYYYRAARWSNPRWR